MWIVLSLIVSLADSIYQLLSQHIKMKPSIFMTYRGLFVAFILFPFLWLFPIITSWQFYAIAIFQGILVSYSDLCMLKANRRYGAETVSSLKPLSVSTIFLFWCVIQPSIVLEYLENPIQSILIILSLLGITYALMEYKKVEISKEAFIFILPLIICSTFIEVGNKYIMYYANNNPLGLSLWRACVSSFCIGSIHLFFYIRKYKNITELVDISNMKNIWIFAIIPVTMILKNVAMYYATNPAFVTAFLYTSLFGIMFINRCGIIKAETKCLVIENKWAILLLFSIIVLILCTK